MQQMTTAFLEIMCIPKLINFVFHLVSFGIERSRAHLKQSHGKENSKLLVILLLLTLLLLLIVYFMCVCVFLSLSLRAVYWTGKTVYINLNVKKTTHSQTHKTT